MDGESSANPVIPEHQLLKCIGRGSYGQVWLARNTMGMYRAVKIVFRRSFSSQRPFERELSGIRTFEPISRSHEGFIDVLQVGINEVEGYFYYIMEIGDDEVSGQQIDPEKYSPRTLGSDISPNGKFSLEQCLRLGLAITDALSELHKHELVHRDIKPSNIIFVNGVPKLADIGLVAALKEAHSYVGTEGFIPPEGPGTPQADLYSLGKVLYEASTGKDRHEFPVLPAQWSDSPEYAGLLELNEVILHSCHQNPAKRYGSAWEMHGELLLVLNGKSVRRLRILERRLMTLKRAGSLAAVAAVIAAVVLYNIYRERRVAADLRQHQIVSDVAYGNRAMDSGDLFTALPYFAEALKLDQGDPQRETKHRLRLGSVLAQCPKLTRMWSLPVRANAGWFSPDGQRILVGMYFTNATIFDVESAAMYSHPFGPKEGVRTLTYSRDGKWIATASPDGKEGAVLWDAVTLSKVATFVHPLGVYQARFSPDGRKLVTACADWNARIWDLETSKMETLIPAGSSNCTFAAFSRDGTLIVTTSRDGFARIWHANGKPTPLAFLHSSWVTYADISPGNKRVVVACHDYKAHVWDLTTGSPVLPDLRHDDVVGGVEYSPDGQVILTASNDNTARLWRSEDLLPISACPVLRHSQRVLHASWSPDGHQIITSCLDGTVRIWDLAGGAVPPPRQKASFCADASRYLTLTNNVIEVWDTMTAQQTCSKILPPGLVSTAGLNDDGRFVVVRSILFTNSIGTNYSVQVYDASQGGMVGPAILISNQLNNASSSHDGQRLVTCSDRVAQLWDTRSGSALSPPMVHPVSVTNAILSPANDFIVSTAGTNAFLWNCASGTLICPGLPHPIDVSHTEISRDGKYLVSSCNDGSYASGFSQVWDTRTGAAVGRRLWHGDGVLCARFSPDDKFVVTASEDYTARTWETATGNEIGLPVRHLGHVWSVAFNADASWLVTASADKTARVWDAGNRDPLTPPLGQLDKLMGAKFLPDGRHIATADIYGFSSVWSLPVDERPVSELVALATFLSGGNFASVDQNTGSAGRTLEKLWQSLRTQHPEDFTTSKAQVVRWHEFRAEESRLQKDWFAARFHLKILLSERPQDPDLASQLEFVTKKSGNAN